MPPTDDLPTRSAQPVAWLFQRNTSRWIWNSVEPTGLFAPTGCKEDPLATLTSLPKPKPPPGTLAEALSGRCSCRHFRPDPLETAELSTLLWSAYGVVGRSRLGVLDWLDRPVPSGGGLYPLEVYVLARDVVGVASGVQHYVPSLHGLELVREGPLPDALIEYLFMGQDYPRAAPATIVITTVFARSLPKYGDRGLRYIFYEAGHVMQNIALTATALNLGTCQLGGFFDDELAALLRADVEHEVPLYAAAVGQPVAADREHRRSLTVPADASSDTDTFGRTVGNFVCGTA